MSVYKGSQKQSEIYKGLKYYKYESWTQPTLSSDTSYGTISSSITTWGDGQVWHISDGVKGTSNKWGGGSGSGNITWHLFEKIKINSFQVWQTNESGYLNRFPKTIKLYASDDGTNYTEVGSLSGYSQPASAGYVTVTCNTSKVYEYYRWEFGTSWKGSEIAVSEIVITAQKVVAGTSSNYDYTEPQKIKSIYKGNILLYTNGISPGTIIFESSIYGTYTVNIPNTQNYYIELVGGGGGGTYMGDAGMFGGGAGGYISGTIYLSAGNYTLVIGNKGTNGIVFSQRGTAGEDTTFYNQIAGGGKAYNTYEGGTCTITENTLTGVNGNNGGQHTRANSVYDNTISGYGAGGYGATDSSDPAIAGYAKIVTA